MVYRFVFFILISTFLFINRGKAQFFIEPSIGLDYYKNRGLESRQDWMTSETLSDNGFSNSHINFGLAIWKQLSEKSKLGIKSIYNQGALDILHYDLSNNIMGAGRYRINRYHLQGLLRFKILNNIELGSGPSLSFFTKATTNCIGCLERFSFKEFQFGWNGFVSFNFLRFRLYLNYSLLNSVKKNSLLANTHITGITLGYRFKVFDKS